MLSAHPILRRLLGTAVLAGVASLTLAGTALGQAYTPASPDFTNGVPFISPLENPTNTSLIPPLARLTNPIAGQSVKGVVTITGLADWPGAAPFNFTQYSVDWGSGSDPQSWNNLSASPSPGTALGALATWDTSGTPDGQYVVRLGVGNASGGYSQVRIPIVVNNTGQYAGPVFPVSQPAAQPAGNAPAAAVVSSSSYSDPISRQTHVVGEVQNTGNVNLQFVAVNANLKDASGNVLQSGIGYALLPTLVPGQKAPFDIFFIPVAGIAGAPDLSLSFTSATDSPTPGLSVSGDHLTLDGTGRLHLTGFVTNSTRDVSQAYRVAYTIYGSSGAPIRTGAVQGLSAGANNASRSARLDPGTSGNFDWIIPNPPATWSGYALAIQ